MNNLHISLTNFKYESRILKQVSTLKKTDIFKKIYIFSLYNDNLHKFEQIDEDVYCYRIEIKSKNMPRFLLFQIIKYFEFCCRVLILTKGKNISVVNIHSLPLIPLSFIIRIFYKSKLIYDAHELETEIYGLSGIKKIIAKFLEKIFINKFNLIFVVSENIANWYEYTYKINRPIVIFNAPYFQDIKKFNIFRKKLKISENKKIILYQGGLSPGRGIEILMDTFINRFKDDCVVIFMGYGILKERIIQNSKKYKNIYFHESVDPYILLKYTASADIGIAYIENTCLSYNYCMPNKLFEYAMVGLPVIVSNVKEMSECVMDNNFGVVISKPDKYGINDSIDKILSMDLESLGKNAKIFAEKNSWNTQEKKILDAYSKLFIN